MNLVTQVAARLRASPVNDGAAGPRVRSGRSCGCGSVRRGAEPR